MQSKIERPTVLLVDDQKDFTLFMSKLLANQGFAVLVAHHVTEALLLLQNLERSIHAIVSDYQMPDFSGLDLLKTLKEHDHNLPFFFLTGSADFSATEALKAGALHLFRKPCSAGEIAVHIRQSLNGCPHEPEIVSSVQIS